MWLFGLKCEKSLANRRCGKFKNKLPWLKLEDISGPSIVGGFEGGNTAKLYNIIIPDVKCDGPTSEFINFFFFFKYFSKRHLQSVYMEKQLVNWMKLITRRDNVRKRSAQLHYLRFMNGGGGEGDENCYNVKSKSRGHLRLLRREGGGLSGIVEDESLDTSGLEWSQVFIHYTRVHTNARRIAHGHCTRTRYNNDITMRTMRTKNLRPR